MANLIAPCTLAAILFAGAGQALAQESAGSGSLAARVRTAVGVQFEATRCPGLSLAVAADNQVIFSEAYGMADLEQDVRLDTDGVHRLASLSKPVTGTIIMDLVEARKLSLDEPVRTYVAGLPAAYGAVTIRHLLTHQAGVRVYRDLEEVFSAIHYTTSTEALKAFDVDPLLFAPGTRTEYSTYGFTVLGAVAEAVTGKAFQDLASDFFVRHQVDGFGFDDPLVLVPGRVRGYWVDDGGKIWNARGFDPSNIYPGGGFVSSAEDYLEFVISISSGRILEEETLREMWRPQSLSDGTETPFGLGWGVGTLRGHRMVGFNGLQPSTETRMRFFPEEGVGFVLACNAEGGRDLTGLLRNVLDVVLPTKN